MKELRIEFAVSSKEYSEMVFHRNMQRKVEYYKNPFLKSPPKEDSHFYGVYEFNCDGSLCIFENHNTWVELINVKIKNKEIKLPNDFGDLKAIFVNRVCLKENGIVMLQIDY